MEALKRLDLSVPGRYISTYINKILSNIVNFMALKLNKHA
jgi:hypothetical protein